MANNTVTMMTVNFLSSWCVLLVILVTTTTQTQAWTSTTTTTTTQSLQHSRTLCVSTPSVSSTTALFAKKKKKADAGGGGPKIQVKLLQHIDGTGQLGEVILVTPAFYANKLRPQKLARKITDEEVEKDKAEKEAKADALKAEAKALKDLIDAESSEYALEFLDNQKGPDGKLFGGIGVKKLMESLRQDCKEFGAFSKRFTKQVSILDIEERMEVEDGSGDDDSDDSKYKDYASYSSSSQDEEEKEVAMTYSSLPKSDKLTIKHAGTFRVKVSLTKDLFAKVKIVVE